MDAALPKDGKSDGPGMLLVVSGPSGSGKSTLVHRVIRSEEFPLVFSVSATSRRPRAGELEGRDYFFLERSEFLAMEGRGEFLEHAIVHGDLYGTPRRPVEEAIAVGHWVLLEIDVQGHRQVKRWMPEARSFFIRAASMEDYERRLQMRGTETTEVIERRLQSVREELACAIEFDYQIVNEDIEQATRTWRTLLAGICARKG